MRVGRFAGILAAMLLAALVLGWVFVSLAALAYALSQDDGRAATTYALFAGVGIAVGGLAAWAVRRVAGARRERD
ncbi:hypothetical protein [Knoellia aerolata]|uniref:Uncharacterized protein n=1 Tax=Knoellia aerolata DSM 18566 TaxID=1385519 RepID=A0A0A0K5N0_9MICO|nr:hypothetical protein [Knoellia aerolata]KGN43141.1 hypothetical protein N801_05805 [Knoellia aerolata DSM 18566]